MTDNDAARRHSRSPRFDARIVLAAVALHVAIVIGFAASAISGWASHRVFRRAGRRRAAIGVEAVKAFRCRMTDRRIRWRTIPSRKCRRRRPSRGAGEGEKATARRDAAQDEAARRRKPPKIASERQRYPSLQSARGKSVDHQGGSAGFDSGSIRRSRAPGRIGTGDQHHARHAICRIRRADPAAGGAEMAHRRRGCRRSRPRRP